MSNQREENENNLTLLISKLAPNLRSLKRPCYALKVLILFCIFRVYL